MRPRILILHNSTHKWNTFLPKVVVASVLESKDLINWMVGISILFGHSAINLFNDINSSTI